MNRIETIPAKGTVHTQPLKERLGMPPSVHLLDRASALAINAALATGRPLLVRGDPGMGKSQLARAAAEILERSLITFTVNSRTETDALLFEIDMVARLAEAQMLGPKGDRELLKLEKFVRPGPLWWGFDWKTASGCKETTPPDAEYAHGAVVLIDELDKADAAIPNGLLDAMGHGGFDVPGMGRVSMNREKMPLVIFTTNNERTLPDAFLRRCFVLELSLPTERTELEAALVTIGKAHKGPSTVLTAAAKLIADARLKAGRADRYRPGIAEFLDLVAAVQGADDPLALLDELSTFVLKKEASR